MSDVTGEAWWTRFQALLDDQNEWPAAYVFKFIVPHQQLEALRDIFGQVSLQTRASSKGKYLSVTVEMMMHSSDEIIAIYTAAGKVDGVIAL